MLMIKEEFEGFLVVFVMEVLEDIIFDFDSFFNCNGFVLFVIMFCLVVFVLCVILWIYVRVWRVWVIYKEESMYF